MKRLVVLFSLLAMALMLVSCASSGSGTTGGGVQQQPKRDRAGGLPPFARDLQRNAPEDALVGVGAAKMSTVSQSRTMASTRARAEISRALNTVISDMVTDYVASSEVDPSATLAFQENITRALSQSRLVGAVVVDEGADEQGTWWTVVMMRPSSAATEINQAVAAAKLQVPQMRAFDAVARMDSALAKQAQEPIRVVDR